MRCGGCERDNRDDARFCAGCGATLTPTCSACGRELAADARFCDGCGAAIGTAPPSNIAVRKTVTALFCDLVGSTAFEERVDPESARETLGRYHRLARECIEEHGGTVAKFIGDGVMALFGVPEVAEDDADRAVRTGLALQQRFSAIRDHIADRHGMAVGLRVGINTGEVVTASTDDDIVGDALNTAARLEGACTPGEVLVGEETWRLTRSAIDFDERGEIAAKGKGQPVRSYVAISLTEVDDRAVTPFVGRSEELRRLQVVIDDTVLQRAARLVTIIGAPGVGKTRLAKELRNSIEGGTRAFDLRCERTGAATFAPIAELLRSLGAVEGLREILSNTPDAERIVSILGGLLGSAPMRPTEEIFLGVRRLFEVLGAVQPVVLVVDDVQWAEPLLLDLLDHLAEWVAGVPLLVVCLARPEIRDLRPTLSEPGKRVAAVVSLDGLTASETAELAARLLGADALPAELVARIPQSTQGNPLFVRELVRMLVDDGIVASRDGTWTLTVPANEIDVPPTVHSLLASRLERMPDDERTVLEHASVAGHEFPLGAVGAALGVATRDLTEVLDRLRRKELVEPTGTYWGDEPVYRFHHVLIRDAAYRRLLKSSRAELHVRIGEWTEQAAASLNGEHEVTIGTQFEHAYLLRTELDLDDDDTSALCQRAAGLFETAATRALERDDLAAAGSLARRALDCRSDEPGMLIVACEAALGSGEVAAGRSLIERLEVAAGADERLLAWLDCFRVELTVFTDPGGLAEAERLACDAADRLEALDDLAGVAKARLQCAAVLVRLGRVGECEQQLDLALTAARAVDDRRRITAVLGAAPIAALWGPSPVARAGGRCLDVVRLLRITTASPAVEATSVRCQAVLEALRGRFDTARTMLQTARATVVELGLERGLLETDLYAGLVELYADDPEAAEPFLRSAYEGLGQLGIGADAGQAAAYLARALLLQGRLDEADDVAAESDALAGQNPQSAIVSRSVQAEIIAARGHDHDAAIELAEEAASFAAGSDILVDHAQALAALARVRASAGDADGADDAARQANELYDRKGASLRTRTSSEPSLDRPAAVEQRPGGSGAGKPQFESGLGSSSDGYRNTADRVSAQAAEAFFTGRMDDVIALQTDDIEFEDRRTGLAVQTSGTADFRTLWQANVHDDPPSFHFETLATRGEHLVLKRGRTQGRTGADNPAGTVDYEYEWLSIDRTNESGLRDLNLLLDTDALDQALEELERLWHESSQKRSARIVAREATELHLAGRVDDCLALFTPDAVLDDRRALVGARAEGIEAIRAQWARSSSSTWTGDVDCLATRGDALALQRVAADQEGRSIEFVEIYQVDAEGRVLAEIMFDAHALHEAVEELDRLWLDSLPLERRFAQQGILTFTHMLGLGEADWIRPFYHRDVEIADYRAASYGTTTLDAMMRRHAELPRLGDATAYLVVEPAGDDTRSLFHQRIEIETDGARSVIEHHGVGVAHPDEARAHRTEMWETDREASESFNRQAGVIERTPRWNPAAVQAMTAPLFLSIPTDVWPSYCGLDRLRGAIERGEPQPFAEKQRVIATRGQHFALIETTTDFVVVEIDDLANLTDWATFDRRLAAALDHLDARVAAVLGDLPILAGTAYARGIRRQDQALVDSVAADDLVMIDHRLAYLPDNRADEIVDALSPLASDGSFPIVVEVFESTASTSLVRMAIMRDELGQRRDEFPGIGLTHVQDGKVVVAEIFAIDDVEAARARYHEVAGASKLPTYRNDADRVSGEASRLIFGGDLEACVALLTDDTVLEDRRAVITSRIEGKQQFRHAWANLAAAEWSTIDLETIATRGNHLVLKRATAIGRPPEGATDIVGEFEQRWIEVNRINDAGLRDLEIVFDPTDLLSAVEELDRLYLESLSLAERSVCIGVFGMHHILSLGRAEWTQHWYHADARAIDHRPGGFGEIDRGEIIERNTELPGVVMLVDTPESDGVRALMHQGIHFSPGERAAYLDFFGTGKPHPIQGRPLLNEQFADAEAARARYAQLCEEPDPIPRWNAAFRQTVWASVWAQIPPEAWPSYAGMDRLRAAIESGEPHPFDGDHRLVATRGERLALIETASDFVVVEIDAEAQLVGWELFGEDLRSALDLLDERFGGTDPDPAWIARATYGRGTRLGDQDLVDSVSAHDLVLVDHRLGYLPDTPASELVERIAPLGFDDSFPVTLEILSATPTTTLSRLARMGNRLGQRLDEFTGFIISHVNQGRVAASEIFAIEDLELAQARFDALTENRSAGNYWSRADELAAATIRAGLGGGVDAYMSLQADDIAFTDHRPMLQTSFRGKPAMHDYFEGAMTTEWERYDYETVAVRGENLSLHHLNGTVVGLEYDWYVLSRFDDDGLCDIAEMFGEDQLAEASERLDELYLGTAAPAEAMAYRNFLDAQDAAAFGPEDRFRARFYADFIAIDHRQGVWPDLDLDGWVDRIASLRQVGDSVTTTRRQVFDLDRGSPRLARQSFHFTNPDGTRSTAYSVTVVQTDDGTGLASRIDLFDDDQLDEAGAYRDSVDRGIRPNLLVSAGALVNVRLLAGEPIGEFVDRALLDRPHPYGVETRNIIAVRGDRLGWFEVQLADGTWVFSVEECDPDGRITNWRLFDADQRTDAALWFGDRNLAINELTEVERAMRLLVRANIAWGSGPDGPSAPR